MNEIVFEKLGIRFSIDPIAFKLGTLEIYWYALIIVVGIIAGFLYACWFCIKDKEDTETLYDILLFGLPSAIIGARLYYVIFNFSEYKDNLTDIFKIHEGGLAIYGGVIFALLSTWIYCRKKRKNILQFFDYGSAGLFVGQSIGRWGNLINQEAFGKNCNSILSMKGNIIEKTLILLKESGLDIDPSLGVHPTFLYESLWNLTGALLMIPIFKRRKHYGTPFAFYLIWYSLGRFFIESLRTDSLMLGSKIRVSQLVAVIFVIIGLFILFKNFRKRENDIADKEKE